MAENVIASFCSTEKVEKSNGTIAGVGSAVAAAFLLACGIKSKGKFGGGGKA